MDFGHFWGKYVPTIFRPVLDISTFFQKIRSGPLTLARQGSILAGAPTVPQGSEKAIPVSVCQNITVCFAETVLKSFGNRVVTPIHDLTLASLGPERGLSVEEI